MISERVRYLLASSERVRILEALSVGPARQCDLGRRCGVARSTVHRNLEGLEERGWVAEEDSQYRITPAGQRLLDAYGEFADTVDTLSEHGPVLRHLTEVPEPIPTSSLEACETTPMTEGDPHAPMVSAADVLRRNAGDRLRIAAGTISPITNRATLAAVGEGSRVESVVDKSGLETLRRSYGDAMQSVPDMDRVDLLSTQTSIDPGIVLAEDEVCVVVHDDNGTATASLTGDASELITWAERVYGRIRDRADPIELSAVVG